MRGTVGHGVAQAVRPAIAVPEVDLVQGTISCCRAHHRRHLLRRKPSDGRAVFGDAVAGSDPDRHHRDPYAGDPTGRAAAEEEEYLLKVAARYFPAIRP